MLKLVVICILALTVIAITTVMFGAARWEAGTRALRAKLMSARLPIQPSLVNFRELDGLPIPVQRYFRLVLKEGQPMVAGVRLQHRGSINMGETSDRWKPFTSDQQVIMRRPGFDWNAKVAMMPGVTVRVHDAYVGGSGFLHAALFGLFTVADLQGTGAVAQGELMRFFAEAAWYPTALLPSQGIRWDPVSDRAAHGTLVDGPITITMLFTFNEEGAIETVRAEARGRTVGRDIIPTPWQGHFWNYQTHDGMYVPFEGEVAWLLPNGPKAYWRGVISGIAYDADR